MSQSKIGKIATRLRDLGRSFLQHIRKKGKATVFVVACVTIAHSGFKWLDSVDSYAFLALGNLASYVTGAGAAATKPDEDSLVVVRIDEQTFRTRYRERSPLDRCVLSSQLSAIYDAAPEVLVIDLDLSPAVDDEGGCQGKLHETLRSGAKRTRTVIMEPFDSFDPAVTTSRAEWRRQLEGEKEGDPRIRFGDAALPVNYGSALHYYTGTRTLYEAARRSGQHPPMADEARAPSRDHRRIDVRAYTSKLQPVLTSWTDTAEGAGYTDNDLTDTLRTLWAEERNRRIVFFGAGYGQEDTYLTPVGTLYGVEIHAAAFWSGGLPFWRSLLIPLAALLVDIIFAFGFGFIIAGCWQHYFAWRFDEGSTHEQLAWIWVAIMLVGLLLAVAIASVISFALLICVGMWLSPIPVAVGMLIEGCMVGSVEAAIQQLRLIQADPASIPTPASITKIASKCKKAIWLIALAAAPLFAISH